MGGMILPQTVRSSDNGQLVLPGRAAMAGKGGQVLTVKADASGYELAPGGGGGGGGGASDVSRVEVYSFDTTVDGLGNRTMLCKPSDSYLDKLGATAPDLVIDPVRGYAPAATGRYLCRVSAEVRFKAAPLPDFVFGNVTVGGGADRGMSVPAMVWPPHAGLAADITGWASLDFTWQPVTLQDAATLPGGFQPSLYWQNNTLASYVFLKFYIVKVG